MKSTKKQYLAAVENIAVKTLPDIAGKINWNTAIYCFNTGKSAEYAVNAVIREYKTYQNKCSDNFDMLSSGY